MVRPLRGVNIDVVPALGDRARMGVASGMTLQAAQGDRRAIPQLAGSVARDRWFATCVLYSKHRSTIDPWPTQGAV